MIGCNSTDDELEDRGRAYLAEVKAERDRLRQVLAAARKLAEVRDYAYTGPGQYAAAGAALALKEAIEAYDSHPADCDCDDCIRGSGMIVG